MKRWDVFISYSSDDKATVVLPLAALLRDAGLRVWVDQQQIRIGDDLLGTCAAAIPGTLSSLFQSTPPRRGRQPSYGK